MKMTKTPGIVLVALVLAACSVDAPSDVTRLSPSPITMPPMKIFANNAGQVSLRSNVSIAQDFLDLSFRLESGRQLPVLSRFEGPITLRVTGTKIPATAQADLGVLLSRLRREAKIPISQVSTNQDANITVQFMSRRNLHRVAPQAACFVAPRVSNWDEYQTRRLSQALDWTTLVRRDRMAVFLPNDVSGQEVRDCLHEEIAQALGPVNDLYRLTDSVFNDDNFHTVLTGFDMVVLRSYYDASLQSGMTQAAVRARLPAILYRINPRGRGGGSGATANTSRAWIKAVEAALGNRVSPQIRLGHAGRAVKIARNNGWHDNRLGFSLFARGRLALSLDTALAIASFSEAEAIFRRSKETRLHAAHVAVQSAAYALSAGHPAEAIKIVNANARIARNAKNANLLTTFLMIKAQALDTQGHRSEAEVVRRESLGWARYGIGDQREIRARLREIAALAPPTIQSAEK